MALLFSPRVVRRSLPIAVCLLLLGGRTARAHSAGGYDHGSSIGYSNADWMSGLPGALRLSELSIPGTHDSLARHGGDAVECQSMSLATQLDSGIRMLDVRCRHIDDVFAIHHGFVFQEAFFGGDVMEPCIAFLAAHPGETILMRVKEEYDEENVTRTFDETFAWYMGFYGASVWTPTEDTNPRLEDVRGKIVILQDFSGSDWGLDWDDAVIQDDYDLSTNWDLYDKWETVKAQIEAAEVGSRFVRYVNFLSGSGGAFPYFVASGHSSPATGAPRLATGHTTATCNSSCYADFPRVDCLGALCTVAFEGTNELTRQYLGRGHVTRPGIIVSDFPGAGLIDAIINENPWNYPPVAWAGGPYVAGEGSPVVFDASGSYDPDGDALSFRWDFEDDGVWDTAWSTDPTATRTWGDDFTGHARVEVSDGKSTAEALATVEIGNVAPSAVVDEVIQPSPDAILPFQVLGFRGSFTDPGWEDGHDAAWDLGDGSSVDGAPVEENDEPDATGTTEVTHVGSPGTELEFAL